MHTFYLAPENWANIAEISGDEFHHITAVLRLSCHDSVYLIDGRGRKGIFEMMTDENYMREALRIAKNSIGRTSQLKDTPVMA